MSENQVAITPYAPPSNAINFSKLNPNLTTALSAQNAPNSQGLQIEQPTSSQLELQKTIQSLVSLVRDLVNVILSIAVNKNQEISDMNPTQASTNQGQDTSVNDSNNAIHNSGNAQPSPDILSNLFQSATNWINDGGQLWKQTKKVGNTIWKGVSKVANQSWKQLKKVGTDIWKTLESPAKGLGDFFANVGSSIFSLF